MTGQPAGCARLPTGSAGTTPPGCSYALDHHNKPCAGSSTTWVGGSSRPGPALIDPRAPHSRSARHLNGTQSLSLMSGVLPCHTRRMSDTNAISIRHAEVEDRASLIALSDRLCVGVASWRDARAVLQAVRGWVETSLEPSLSGKDVMLVAVWSGQPSGSRALPASGLRRRGCEAEQGNRPVARF